MRSMLSAFTLGAFLALAGASPAFAASHQFSGEIGKVDGAAKTLLVKTRATPAKEMTFELGPDAKILRGMKTLDLSALKAGETVKVTYLDEGMRHKAQKIEVRWPKTAAVKSAPKPPTRY